MTIKIGTPPVDASTAQKLQILSDLGILKSTVITSGTPIVIPVTVFPASIYINPSSGCTIQVEKNAGGYTTVGSYSSPTQVIVDYRGDETTITDIRLTRTAGSTTTSKVTIGV